MYLGGNRRWVPLVRSPIRFDNFLVSYSFFSFDLKKEQYHETNTSVS